VKRVIYDIALFLFPVLLRLVSPIHAKAKLMIDGRKHWEEELENSTLDGPTIWFHCASLGEFEQGRPLIEHIKKSHPNYGIFITFFSPSGYEVRKDYEVADYICYLPFDNKRNAIKLIELVNPSMAIFIKYEFWYNYLSELKNKRIPTFSISAIFRPDQQFFKKNGQFFRKMLACFDQFFVQNEASKNLLNKQGFNNVMVSGDTRFDRVKEVCSNPDKNVIASQFKGHGKVMVIGSSWPEDIEVLLPIINSSENKLKFIIAPHEVEKSKINKLCSKITSDFQLYSQVSDAKIHESKVLIIDNIGMLSSLFQYGDIAYIGGAFGEGLHNILEAATFGMPIVFGRGKDNHKYQEAVDLVDLGGAFEISDSPELKKLLDRLLDDEAYLESTSKICSDYVDKNAGATERIMNSLINYLN
jgi:3-deoxy-D-manno-octulosonic-acid transferase